MIVSVRPAAPLASGLPPAQTKVVLYIAAEAPPPKVSTGSVTMSPLNTATAAPAVPVGAVELKVALLAPPLVVAVAVCPVVLLAPQALTRFNC